MIKIKEAIVVEGRYDKNKLSQIVDTMILETGGFGIFNSSEKRALFQKICEKRGLIILTDSDSAGFVIRNHLRGILPKNQVKHAYIPQIRGKERRKEHASKEGLLGVEGMNRAIVLEALERAGATFLDQAETKSDHQPITKTDFYELGLSGGRDSAHRRAALLKTYGLPTHMTANALLEALNILMNREELKALIGNIQNSNDT